MNKDINICRQVILDRINELKKKEENSRLESDSYKYIEQRLTLLKALEILSCKDSEEDSEKDSDVEFTFTCDCCGEVLSMKYRNVLFGKELCPECYI